MKKSPLSKRGLLEALRQWTESHHGVQNRRRNTFENIVDLDYMNATDLNYRIGRFLSDHARRAPYVPRDKKHTTFLYRGMHGDVVRRLKDGEKIHFPGYISTSLSMDMASHFAGGSYVSRRSWQIPRDGIVIRIRIRDIPVGTPWVWFDHGPVKSSPQRHGVREEEVLLPPGFLQLHNTRPPTATYTPDYEARASSSPNTLSIGPKITRSRGPVLNTRDPLQPYQETWRLFNNTIPDVPRRLKRSGSALRSGAKVPRS